MFFVISEEANQFLDREAKKNLENFETARVLQKSMSSLKIFQLKIKFFFFENLSLKDMFAECTLFYPKLVAQFMKLYRGITV